MNRFHFYRYFPILLGVFLLWGLLGKAAQANSGRSGQTQSQSDQSPVRQGLPGRRISGGSRGPVDSCLPSASNLVALMPEGNLGTTASQTPTLWFYLPQTGASSSIEFLLFNQQDELIYAKQLPANPQAGIVGLTLPPSELGSELMLNQPYRWYLAIVCDADDRSGDIWVEGNLQRIEAPAILASQLATAMASERPAIYRAAGLWHEAITDLVMRSQHGGTMTDTALAQQWQTLLESVNLGNALVVPPVNSWRTIELSFNP
jgi:Domain of Unknown Function (DUF928)